MTVCDEVWEVTGGASKGGIIVRTGREICSEEADQRLSTGARIRLVEKSAGRASFELLSGIGPKTGWVSVKSQGKELLTKIEGQSQKTLREYCGRFGDPLPQCHPVQNRQSFAINFFSAPTGDKQLQAELEREISLQRKDCEVKDANEICTKKFTLKGWAEDSDGEEVRICHWCKLPMGDIIYRTDKDKDYIHGECLAQLTLKDLRKEEERRIQDERVKKNKQHTVYGIGWHVSLIPRNDHAASKLAMRDVPQGMVCVVLDTASNSIRLASTGEPSAAINLEYLSTALEVRRTEGHEPVFSLDPTTAQDKNSMQEKVFFPEWLAGTRVGEVLFQADYHLKELSMGDSEQPVVGMKSCFEHTELQGHYDWSAREWFLVRKAEIQLSESGMVIPMVKLGVEARAQVLEGSSLEDKAVTSEDHPMARYAQEFTRNFDLIAERKSVFYHLRELAKASAMAKYLLDSGRQLEESWFHLGQQLEVACSLEVPQLWNDRNHSELQLERGTIGRHINPRSHAVYGGVQFGLQKFNLAASVARQASLGGISRQQMSLMSSQTVMQPKLITMASGAQGMPPKQLVTLTSGAQFAPPSASLAASLVTQSGLGPAVSPSRLSAALSAASLGAPRLSSLSGAALSVAVQGGPKLTPSLSLAPTPKDLHGVDLRLDDFDLSNAKPASLEAPAGSWCDQVKSLNECACVGSLFFSAFDDSLKLFRPDDRVLLKSIFDPALSDRRSEGDLFIPPDPSCSYVSKLRDLVKQEELVRSMRKEHFFSEHFSTEDPGPFFPHSWTPSFAISRGCSPGPEIRSDGALVARPRSKLQVQKQLQHIVDASCPTFDKRTEEGLRFRIYRLGSLEIRTTQELEGDEIVGAVFSVQNHALQFSSQTRRLAGNERIVKATEYVEKDFTLSSSLKSRYYVVLETETAHNIVAERSSDGSLAWIENPEDLEDRSSLAKMTRTQKSVDGITAQDAKNLYLKLREGEEPNGAPRSSKQFARTIFQHVVGKAPQHSKLFPPTVGTMLRFPK